MARDQRSREGIIRLVLSDLTAEQEKGIQEQKKGVWALQGGYTIDVI